MTYYMGHGNGCRHVLRCEIVGFEKQLDCENLFKSKQDAIKQINDIAFERFRKGQIEFQPAHRQETATNLIQLSNSQLIEMMYVDKSFKSEIIKREMIFRKIMDDDIYKIGFYGNEIAKSQAIELMKHKVL